MSKYDDAKATDKTVLLPLSEQEAMRLRSLMAWTLMEMEGSQSGMEEIEAIFGRFKKLIPSPGATTIKIG